MRDIRKRELGRWLAVALRHLSWGEGKAFGEEIRAHYSDGFRGYECEGLTPGEAHRMVMADLGDPLDVARAFAKECARKETKLSLGTRVLSHLWFFSLSLGSVLMALWFLGTIGSPSRFVDTLGWSSLPDGVLVSALWLGFHPLAATLFIVLLLGLGGMGWAATRGWRGWRLWTGAGAGLAVGSLFPMTAILRHQGFKDLLSQDIQLPGSFILLLDWVESHFHWLLVLLFLLWLVPTLAVRKERRMASLGWGLVGGIGAMGFSLGAGDWAFGPPGHLGSFLSENPDSLFLAGCASSLAVLALFLGWRPTVARMHPLGPSLALALIFGVAATASPLKPYPDAFDWEPAWVSQHQYIQSEAALTTSLSFHENRLDLAGVWDSRTEGYGARLSLPHPDWGSDNAVPLPNILHLLRDAPGRVASRERIQRILETNPEGLQVLAWVWTVLAESDPTITISERQFLKELPTLYLDAWTQVRVVEALARLGEGQQAGVVWDQLLPRLERGMQIVERARGTPWVGNDPKVRAGIRIADAFTTPLYAEGLPGEILLSFSLPPEIIGKVWVGLSPVGAEGKKGTILYPALYPLDDRGKLFFPQMPPGAYALSIAYRDGGSGKHPTLVEGPQEGIQVWSGERTTREFRIVDQEPLALRCSESGLVWDAYPGAITYRVEWWWGDAPMKKKGGTLTRKGWASVKGASFSLENIEEPLALFRVVPLNGEGEPLANPFPLQWEDHFRVWAGMMKGDKGLSCKDDGALLLE